MAQDDEDRDGPNEVGRIVSEIFTFVSEHPEAFDATMAEAGAQMTLARLNKICKACGSLPAYDLPKADLIPISEEPIARPSGREQRKMHLLRLVSSKLSHAFDKNLNPEPIDRQVSVGIDIYMRRIFGLGVYHTLNDQAERILMLSGNGDDAVLRTVMGNFMHRQFFVNVLVRIALSFRNFDVAKHLFMEDLNMARPLGTSEISNSAFHLICNAMFNDLFLMAKSQDDGAALDYQYGHRTARGLVEVVDLMSEDRLSR